MTNYISTPLSTLNADLNAIQTTLSSKADKSELDNYAQLSDIPEVEGVYLPLTGGNLNGRIYLVTEEQESDPPLSICVFEGAPQGWNPHVESWETDLSFTITTKLSVYDADQDFIDMLMNSEDFTGEVLTTKTVSVEITIEEIDQLQESWTITAENDVGFGNAYVDGSSMNIDLDIDNEGVVIFQTLEFNMINSGSNPAIVVNVNVEGNTDAACEETLDSNYQWSVEEIEGSGGGGGGTVEVTDSFVLSSELESAIGDINSILDSINGEII